MPLVWPTISPGDLADWQRRWDEAMAQPSQLRWIPPCLKVQFTGPYTHTLGRLDPDAPVPPSYTMTRRDDPPEPLVLDCCHVCGTPDSRWARWDDTTHGWISLCDTHWTGPNVREAPPCP